MSREFSSTPLVGMVWKPYATLSLVRVDDSFSTGTHRRHLHQTFATHTFLDESVTEYEG